MAGVALASSISLPALADCGIDAATGQDVTIADTRPGGLIVLGDGRLVALAGLDWESLQPPSLSGQAATFIGATTGDRHGALRGDLWIDGTSLALTLLGEGKARVRPHPGETVCFDSMLEAEDGARRAGLGLWAEPGYAVAKAADADAVGRQADRFAVISGRVLHVGTSKDRIWIDFGPIWRTDVTVTLPKKLASRLSATGVDINGLEGQTIRARGVVTMHGGPSIDIAEPAAIELIAASKQ